MECEVVGSNPLLALALALAPIPQRGTVNGIGQSMAAAGRFLGPTIGHNPNPNP